MRRLWSRFTERRELRRRAEAAEKAYDEHMAFVHDMLEATGSAPGDGEIEDRYQATQTDVLVHRARIWDVEVPEVSLRKDSVWVWGEAGPYLKPDARRQLARDIKKAKREAIGWYVQNTIALLGALTGLIAVIKDK